MKNQGELLKELVGTECFCGKSKKSRNTFCPDCFYSLPQQMRKDLYKRFSEGYEQAYENAVKFLNSAKGIESEKEKQLAMFD